MLIHPNFDPVAIDLGFTKVYWYGLMYVAGFIFADYIFKYFIKTKRTTITHAQLADAIFFGALGLVLGARMGYVLIYGLDRFLADPMWAIKMTDGGMSFHGGFVGVSLAGMYFCKKHKVRVGELANIMAVAGPMGLFFGRIGNFIGQELWGRPTELPWGMIFPKDPSGLARHPSQLYEAVFEGLLVFLIVFWFARKPRPEWSVGGVFLISYGSFRFLMEFFRQPDSHIGFDLLGWMTRGQLLSLPMAIAGCLMLWWSYKRPNPVMAGMVRSK